MKRLTNLIMLVILVSTNIFTPFSYAQVESFEPTTENNVEDSVGIGDISDNNETISDNNKMVPENDEVASENNEATSENNETVGSNGTETMDDVNSEASNIIDEDSGNENDEPTIQINTDTENNTDSESLIDDALFTDENLSKENGELKIQAIDTGNNTHELTGFESAFQEVAYAYYMRGPYLHYNVAKGKGHYYSPEETTSQDYNYMACALYVKNVYKELLGINLGYSDTIDRAYAEKYIGERDEVIGFAKSGYWYDGTKDGNGELIGINIEDLKKSDIINQLKIGDIFGYDGHVMLVYDFKYNEENGEKEDVYLIHATNVNKSYNVKSKIHGKVTVYDSTGVSSNLNIGHSPWSHIRYNKFDRNAISTEYGIHDDARVEGTISLQTMGDAANRETRKVLLFSGNTKDYSNYYYIIRLVTTNSEGKSILNFNGTYSKFQEISGAVEGNDYINTEIDYSDSVKSRLKYSKLYIEKTVDKEDNNIVEPNDELTYIIKIQNNSKKAYDGFIVKENIDTNLVEYLGTSRNNVQLNENQLQWNITGLNSGDEIIIEYTVKVKTGNIGKTIESTGMVENIPSGTIKNIIGKNTDKGEKIKQSYNNLSNNYTGKILINEVYKEIYGVDFGLDKIEINAKNESDTGGLIYFNNKWGSWNNWDDTKMGISKENPYSKMVLNGYFNVLYQDNNDGKGIKAFDGEKDIIIPARYSLPAIAVRLNDPDKRADTIFPSNFQIGDILIYKNSYDIKYSWKSSKVIPTSNTYENGEYAYIYIDGKFIGMNPGNDEIEGTEDDRNEFTTQYYIDKSLSGYTIEGSTSSGLIEMTGGLEEWLQYQTLFGKDSYVILRPSLAIRSIDYELDGGTNDVDNPNGFILGSDNILKEPTKSGYTFNGWFTDSGYTNQVNNTNELTDDAVLYAKWGKNTEYVINYNLNEGIVSGENATRYTIESESITLTNPIKTGYTFVGWSGTDIDGVSLTVTIPKGSIGDRTYEANRNVNQYTIIFNTDGGSEVTSITADYNSVITAPITPTKNGYRFVKWEPELPTTMPLDGLTLKAIWEKNGSSGGGGGGSSGGGSHEGSNNSSTGSNINTNQHGSADEKPQNTKDNTSDIKNESSVKTNDQKGGNTAKQTLISNNSDYTKEFNEAYNFAYRNGITTMSNIENAKMYKGLTRIAMAKMLSNYAINVLGMEPDLSKGIINFNDVSRKLDKQYDNGVTLAYQLGIMGINMKNNNFRPYDTITRGEFATALSRLLYNTPDGNPYYTTHIQKLKKEGILLNDNPKIKESRGYIMIMLMRSAK